ncbi:helix-turn-helix transcriptional regulator [Kitasatospora sp. GAS1066B]|uniref:helix-turn-helix transcriptional regulator n=1 Tax=Kitasatospora sp. GAS1066B TaxID=3156271 RepID=UPI00351897E7
MDDPIRHPLTYVRVQRELTLEDLARLCRQAAAKRGLRSGIDRQRVWKWENYQAGPSSESELLLADALDVPVEDVEMFGWPDWLPGHDVPLPLGSAYTVQTLREAQRTAMDRRNFMTFSAISLAGLAAQWALVEPDHLTTALGGRSVDGELVDWLESTSTRLTTLPTEQRQHTAKLMDAHLATVTNLIADGRYSERTGKRLHLLAASLATTCGWHRFDQGHHSAAGRLWSASLHSAHAAGDRDFGAGVLSDFAYQSNWLGRPNISVDLLGNALSRTEHPTARSLLLLRRARAHAALGERSDCYRDLSAAETELSTTAADPAPSWCVWMSPADLTVDSGQCMLDLGRSDLAKARITEGMSLLPRSRDKTRGIFLTYEARSHLQSGEVERALAVTNESLDLATRIGAERCVTLVRELAPAFRRYQQVEGVPEFLERLRVS